MTTQQDYRALNAQDPLRDLAQGCNINMNRVCKRFGRHCFFTQQVHRQNLSAQVNI